MTDRRTLRMRPDSATPRFAGFIGSAATFALLLAGIAVASTVVAEFATGAAPLPGLPSPSTSVQYGIPLFRVFLDISVVATIGLGLLAKLLGFDQPDRTEPVMTKARRLAVWTSWVWVASALISVVLLSAEVYAEQFPTRTNGFLDVLTSPLSFLQYVATHPNLIWDYIAGVPAGKGLLVSAGFGLMSVWLCRISLRRGEAVPAELRAGIAAFGMLPLPLTGHASAWKYHDFVMMSMELHIIAASAWVGGLGATIVFLARRPALLAIALPRFSRLATYCVFLVVASGLFSGLAMLATAETTVMPDAIWNTSYGQLMIAKLVCVGLIAVSAIAVRRGLMGRIVDQQRTAVATWCGFELIVMAVAYGLAVVLTRSAPY